MADGFIPVNTALTKELHDESGKVIYPVTTADRVAVGVDGTTVADKINGMVVIDKESSLGEAGVTNVYVDGLVDSTDSTKHYLVDKTAEGRVDEDAIWTASKILEMINTIAGVITDNDGNQYRLGFNSDNEFGLILVNEA